MEHLAYAATGREYMLARFANLPLLGKNQVEMIRFPYTMNERLSEMKLTEFREEFGELYPGIRRRDWYNFIMEFRYYWYWKRGSAHTVGLRRPLKLRLAKPGAILKEFNAMDDPSAWATTMLNGRVLELKVDFPAGRIDIRPNTLLDWLVLSFIDCRLRLAICANEECGTPYFVKIHPRTRYCSTACSGIGRQKGQRKWEEEHRTKDAQRRNPALGS